MEARMSKWGNSLGVRIPKSILDETEIGLGDWVTISVRRDGKIVIAPKPKKVRLDDLLRGMRRQDKPGPVDWGKPEGRESW